MPAPAKPQPKVSASTIHAAGSSVAIARRDQRERRQPEREARDGKRDERAAKAAHGQTLTAQRPARTTSGTDRRTPEPCGLGISTTLTGRGKEDPDHSRFQIL